MPHMHNTILSIPSKFQLYCYYCYSVGKVSHGHRGSKQSILKLPGRFVSSTLHRKRADSKLKFQSFFYFAPFDILLWSHEKSTKSIGWREHFDEVSWKNLNLDGSSNHWTPKTRVLNLTNQKNLHGSLGKTSSWKLILKPFAIWQKKFIKYCCLIWLTLTPFNPRFWVTTKHSIWLPMLPMVPSFSKCLWFSWPPKTILLASTCRVCTKWIKKFSKMY